MAQPPSNRLRLHRRIRGFTQAELAFLLGFRDRATISRLERHERAHPLVVAFAYKIIFGIRGREIYPGLYHEVRASVADRIRELSARLQSEPDTERNATKLKLLREALGRAEEEIQSV